MIPEIGHIFLIITFVATIMQILFWIYNIKLFDDFTVHILKRSALINFLFILSSFFILTYSFIISDFSLLLVSNNSHSLKPLIYKISGVWGNHEGSLLLWVLILSTFTFLISIKNSSMNSKLLLSLIHI